MPRAFSLIKCASFNDKNENKQKKISQQMRSNTKKMAQNPIQCIVQRCVCVIFNQPATQWTKPTAHFEALLQPLLPSQVILAASCI